MEHHFDIEDAQKHGVIAAIILHNLKYWIFKNKANDKHFHEGRTWTYNTVEAFTRIFPYLSVWQIRHALEKLLRAGVLLKGNYNKIRYDRTLWYAFVDEDAALEGFQPILQKPQMQDVESTNRSIKNRKPIPNPKPYKLPDKKPKIEISSEDRLDLDLRIAEAMKRFCNEIEKIFHLTQIEKVTFSRITKHLVSLCQAGKATPVIFEAAIGWAKEAKANGKKPKALFVAKVKQETGFKAQSQILKKCG